MYRFQVYIYSNEGFKEIRYVYEFKDDYSLEYVDSEGIKHIKKKKDLEIYRKNGYDILYFDKKSNTGIILLEYRPLVYWYDNEGFLDIEYFKKPISFENNLNASYISWLIWIIKQGEIK